jgi:hypothetical protein
MATRQIIVQRFSVISSRKFQDVVAAFAAGIGHPDMHAFGKNVAAANSFAELESLVHSATRPSELMEFMRLDLGEALRKRNPEAPIVRFIVGNPVTMSKMAQHVPDAGSYAPVTVLIDERPDGVHLSYDRMASFLACYGSPEALKVAQDLDSKVEALLTAAAK